MSDKNNEPQIQTTKAGNRSRAGIRVSYFKPVSEKAGNSADI